MRRSRRGGGFHQELGGSGEDSFVAVVVTKLTGALLFILLLTMVIMALIPKADMATPGSAEATKKAPSLLLEVPEILPEAIAGRPYQFTFSVRGESSAPLQWSIQDALPDGLIFDEKAGRLTGAINGETPETIPLTIQVTDGRSVAGAVTQLPVWNPVKKGPDGESLEPLEKFAGMPMQAWVSQGFGLALIWFGHLAGVGVIDRMESIHVTSNPGSTPKNSGRFRLYRLGTWLVSLIATCAILAWIWM